jgi:hypothetical protein
MSKRTPWFSTSQDNQAPSLYKVHFSFRVSFVQILPLLDGTAFYNALNNEDRLSRNQPFFLSQSLAPRPHF